MIKWPTYEDIRGEFELELIRRAKAGDGKAVATLLHAHGPLLSFVTRRFHTSEVKSSDLAQEARIAMWAAILNHDQEKGFLGAYARKCIKSHLIRYVKNSRHIVRIPVHAQEEMLRLKRANELHEHDVARLRGESVDIDAELDSEDALSIADVTPADGDSAEDILIQLEEADECVAMVSAANLTQRESQILARRFAEEPETLEQIGQTMGVTRERIRQIESDGLRKIRAAIRKNSAEDERVDRYKMAC